MNRTLVVPICSRASIAKTPPPNARIRRHRRARKFSAIFWAAFAVIFSPLSFSGCFRSLTCARKSGAEPPHSNSESEVNSNRSVSWAGRAARLRQFRHLCSPHLCCCLKFFFQFAFRCFLRHTHRLAFLPLLHAKRLIPLRSLPDTCPSPVPQIWIAMCPSSKSSTASFGDG